MRANSMIIDSHVHLKHGNAEKTEYTAEAIIESMDESGVDKSVVFAICTTAWTAVEMAADAQSQYPDRLIPYAYALPSTERPILDILEDAVVNGGFKGIKIHCGECTLADYVSDPVLKLAGKLGVPCLIDFIGRDADLNRMARSFPDTRIIAAHLGRYLGTDQPLMDRFIAIAEACDNVYLDISGVILLWKIREAVERVGASRVIWGSDGPYPTPDLATYIRTDIAKVKASGISETDQQAVLGGTIATLLNI
jgi:predicted TIM-barrel fold metal-dependent hydrolase